MSALLPAGSGQTYGPKYSDPTGVTSNREGEPRFMRRRSERHRPPRSARCEREGAEAREWGENPDLWLYRERTIGMLKRYMRLAIEVGRLPSLLGREFFRTQVTSYRAATFEDSVIFVHDVERCLEKLDGFSQKLLAKIVLQEYTQEEAAGLLGCGRRSVERYFPDALDRLSELFLKGGLLMPMVTPPAEPETCQEGETEEKLASCCLETE
jgi:DNA-directed RNA polymerase specialized sigma24 family protein